MPTDRDVQHLIINKLTKTQYEAIETPDPNQLYFIIDDNDYAKLTDLPQPSNVAPAMDGTAAAGIAVTYSRSDHIHPTDTSKQDKIIANGILKGDGAGGVTAAVAGIDYPTINSPAFTGTPTAPTPTSTSDATQIATKQYVDDAVAGAGSGAKAVTNPALTASEGTFTWNIAAADAFSSPNVIISVYDAATGAIVYPDIVVNQTTGAVTISIKDTNSIGTLTASTYKVVMIG